jgi:hypothetical protein
MENEKQKCVFLGWQSINGNQLLLIQQTCPSMPDCQFVSSACVLLQQFFTTIRTPGLSGVVRYSHRVKLVHTGKYKRICTKMFTKTL